MSAQWRWLIVWTRTKQTKIGICVILKSQSNVPWNLSIACYMLYWGITIWRVKSTMLSARGDCPYITSFTIPPPPPLLPPPPAGHMTSYLSVNFNLPPVLLVVTLYSSICVIVVCGRFVLYRSTAVAALGDSAVYASSKINEINKPFFT